MKGGGGGSLPAKRAWRGLGVAVLGLVILSMLVPLVFLLGLHNGFHTTGYVTEDRSPASDFGRHDPLELSKTQNQSEVISLSWTRRIFPSQESRNPNRSAHLDDIMKRLGPAFSKFILCQDIGNRIKDAEDETNSRGSSQVTAFGKNGLPAPPEIVLKQPPDAENRKFDGSVEVSEYVKGVIAAEAKLPAHDKLSRGLKQNIQEFEHVLSETTTDADLPPLLGALILQHEQKHSIREESLRAGLLPASLLTFQNLVYPLDGSWALSGLGHDYSIDSQAIRRAAVLHYNGNMKPWLELGIPKYKRYWKKFLKREDQFMGECNVNP
ncbi:probable galacturonosyltransferase 7 [Macadamia integrifolia]|uniref:probable galacturonosyltransferase 7 n=1 Tax=Macadamia integrifolia TaxID=60698 RepID=UPI001C4F6066|nr:probable galacturonosyltransferase 7 [Macadamia integrifolia]